MMHTRSAATFIPLIAVLLTIVTGAGCQSRPAAVVEFDDEFTSPLPPHLVRKSDKRFVELWQQRQDEIDAMIASAMLAPRVPDGVQAVFAASDKAGELLWQTLKNIQIAEEIVALNLSNANTTAYKASRYRPRGEEQGQTVLDFSPGPFEATGSVLDLAVEGEGFFRVRISDSLGNSDGYTRNGSFFRNRDGVLVLASGDGYLLEPEITFPPDATDVSISRQGEVTYLKAGQNTRQNVGAIKLTTFVNPQGLKLLGGGLYIESEESGPPIENDPGENGAGTLLQGFLEGSNVDIMRERLRLRFLRSWRRTIEAAMDSAAAYDRPQKASKPDAAASTGVER